MSLAALEAAKAAKEVMKTLSLVGLSVDDGNSLTDFFVATSNRDYFNGGIGNDTVSYAQSTAGVQINLSDNFTELRGFAAGDTLISIENIIGSTSADNIMGSNVANIIHGNSGNDVIDGNGGSDKIYGGDGQDALQVTTTSPDHALLDGGDDSDILVVIAKGGDTKIVTGAGNDDVNIRIMTADHFHVEILDFQPFLNHNSTMPTYAQSVNGDQILFSFNNSIISHPNEVPHSVGETATTVGQVIGNDYVVQFDDVGAHGEVVFVGLASFAGAGLFNFRMDGEFFGGGRPAPV